MMFIRIFSRRYGCQLFSAGLRQCSSQTGLAPRALRASYSTSRASSSRGGGRSERSTLWMLVIPVTTFGLGTWQVFRLQWKLGLIDELERKTTEDPITMPADILERLGELEYRRVQLHGHFDHTKELLMWPRSLNTESTGRGSEPGAHIVTPFYCEELGQLVLVNRGWVPRRKMDQATRKRGQVEGRIELTAVVRDQEKRAPFAPKNNPDQNHWSFRDVAAMAEVAGTAPVFLDADATTTVAGGPIGGQTRVTLRNDHLQYIFTWYALSLITFYMCYQLWTKTKRKR